MTSSRGRGPRLHGCKVLVAEDQALVALNLGNALGELGCVVLPPASSVAEALALLRTERPDVALLDAELADGRATPVAETLAAMGVPFAVVTGHDPGALREPVLRDAVKVGKPYAAGEIGRTIRRLLDPGLGAEEATTAWRGTAADGAWRREVRARAHAAWEREGRPEGRAELHWAQAEEELRSEGRGGLPRDDAPPPGMR
jgi:two-component system, response regulator PdtaR